MLFCAMIAEFELCKEMENIISNQNQSDMVPSAKFTKSQNMYVKVV